MIQGGDPTGTGTGGSDKTIKGEFKANGVNNTLSHTRGVLSMARKGSNPETEATMKNFLRLCLRELLLLKRSVQLMMY